MRRVLILTLLTVVNQATADDRSTAASFMECARIADDARRLACYDRLATELIELGLAGQAGAPAAPAAAPPSSPPASPPASSPGTAAAPAVAAVSGGSGTTASAAAPRAAAPASPTPPAAPASAPGPAPAASSAPKAPSASEADFGRERIDGGDKSEVDEIRSRYVGEFTGWDGKTVFRLENGQVWQQVRSGRLAWRADSPMVTIKRGFFGSYRLSVEGVNKQVYVKRIQ
jgi:hypothetical protein